MLMSGVRAFQVGGATWGRTVPGVLEAQEGGPCGNRVGAGYGAGLAGPCGLAEDFDFYPEGCGQKRGGT